ncbi:MAG: TetR/AcrR family transcriptional regulator [Acidimicrobiales bacterium]|nr:TetR/AcrR family transcriptional regulator [Acidimicrobiales bacterium]MBO0893212.1 TetR/AcrR family transcriptional regulator [Acidimicrobiales bacterium]
MTQSLATSSSPRPVEHRRGRPVDEARHGAIRLATQELLAEVGYDRLTVDAVAARAHASKATIYRRWPSKAELVIDVVGSLAPMPDLADRGSLEADIRAVLGAKEMVDDFRLGLMSGLVGVMARDPELARVFQQRFLAPRARALRQLFERGVGRGELSPEHDLDLLTAVFPAMLCHRALVMGKPIDPSYLKGVVEHVLLPLVRRDPLHGRRQGET